jgi:putative PIN family toxin of toxin-antitoxin system
VRAVTPDANVYISALIWDGEPEQLLEMALARKVRLFISDAIMGEVMEVLAEKFNHSPKRLALEKEYLSKCTVRCVPKIKLNGVKDDHDDNKIIECAVHSRSEAIITNDGDLLRMKSYKGIRMTKMIRLHFTKYGGVAVRNRVDRSVRGAALKKG